MTPESIGFAHYLLAQIKCASVRSRLLTAEIDSVDAALRGDFVSADDALEWLGEIGALHLITAPSSAVATVAST